MCCVRCLHLQAIQTLHRWRKRANRKRNYERKSESDKRLQRMKVRLRHQVPGNNAFKSLYAVCLWLDKICVVKDFITSSTSETVDVNYCYSTARELMTRGLTTLFLQVLMLWMVLSSYRWTDDVMNDYSRAVINGAHQVMIFCSCIVPDHGDADDVLNWLLFCL